MTAGENVAGDDTRRVGCMTAPFKTIDGLTQIGGRNRPLYFSLNQGRCLLKAAGRSQRHQGGRTNDSPYSNSAATKAPVFVRSVHSRAISSRSTTKWPSVRR